MRKLLLLAVTALSPFAFSQPNGWNDPFPPYKIMDNMYYVGTKELASFLIVTPQGNILMNSNYESSVPVIKASVEKLGFKMSDVKILIAGHAHPDHVEGDAAGTGRSTRRVGKPRTVNKRRLQPGALVYACNQTP